jgi:hypothetical protein
MKMSPNDYSHTEIVHKTHKDAKGNTINDEAVGSVSRARNGRVISINQWVKPKPAK